MQSSAKDLFDIGADIDVDTLMAQIRESVQKQGASRHSHSAGPSVGSGMKPIEIKNIEREMHLANSLAEAINQVPLKGRGWKRKLELKVKTFLKWFVHWNTKPQADFNHSLMRAVGLMGQHLQNIHRNMTAIDERIAKEARRTAEANQQLDEQVNRLSSLVDDFVKRADAVATNSLSLERTLRQEINELRQVFQESNAAMEQRVAEARRTAEANQQLNEEVNRLSLLIDDFGKSAAAAADHLLSWERQLSQELNELRQDFRGSTAAIDEMHRDLGIIRQEVQLGAAANEEKIGKQALQTAEASQQITEQVNRLSIALDDVSKRTDCIVTHSLSLEQKLSHEIDEMRMRALRTERRAKAIVDARRSDSRRGKGLAESQRDGSGNETSRFGTSETSLTHAAEMPYESFDYFMFEHQFRGPVAEIRRRQSVYLELFLGKESVLDLGCGRGEFVELLSENGVKIIGVDNNQDMIDFCLDRGLRVVRADIFDYLNSLPDASLDGIFVAQVVEHLPPEEILNLIKVCGDKLKGGGVVVSETVNTECPEALSSFYIDPTHVRPVPAVMLRFMFEQGPFKVQSLKFLSPLPGSNAEETLDITSGPPQEAKLYQDYAVVAFRQ